MKKINYLSLAVSVSLLLTACLKEYDNPAKGTLNGKAELYVIRQAFRGSPVILSEEAIAGATVTSGTVISDKTQGNIEANTFIIQNTTATSNQAGDLIAGIVVEMNENTSIPSLGDSVIINVIGSTLQRKNGKLVLSGVGANKITIAGTNRTVAAQPVTLGMLNARFADYESTLIAVHADVLNYAAGMTYSGEKQLDDHTGTAVLATKEAAAFASDSIRADAQFTGIAGYKNDNGHDTAGAKKIISLRKRTDVNYVSGVLYPGFPESFESPDVSQKASYNITTTGNDIDLLTGSWKLQQAILANTILSDKINSPGKQCVRLQQNLSSSGLVQMNFNLTQGASKVTLFYGKYSTDPMSSFRLEYSVNGGTTWTVVTPTISFMAERGSTQATFMLNIIGNVRFRINKLGLGASSATVQNGRLNIDDIAIYKK